MPPPKAYVVLLVPLLVFFSIVALSSVSSQTPKESQAAEAQAAADVSTAEYLDGQYIPRDLEDAIRDLDHSLPEKDIAFLTTASDRQLAEQHFGLGMGIRNGWGLWRGSRLAKYFNEIGVSEADDMSGLILSRFIMHLRHEEVKPDERIAAMIAKQQIVRKYVLIDAELDLCGHFFTQKSRSLDPHSHGIRVVVAPHVGDERITDEGTNVSLYSAIQQAASKIGWSVCPTDAAIYLVPTTR